MVMVEKTNNNLYIASAIVTQLKLRLYARLTKKIYII